MALEAEPLAVELAVELVVAVVVALEPPPPYWAPTRGRHKREKVYKDALIITATQLDEKILEAKVCVESPTLNFKVQYQEIGFLLKGLSWGVREVP